MKITIIIPCHNEEETIAEVVCRVCDINIPDQKEIIVVDDGSTDGSAKSVPTKKGIILVRHSSRRGKGAAIRSGLQKAHGEIIVVQDADLEYLPENIPRLIEPIQSGSVDVVYGSRFLGSIKNMSIGHYFGNIVLSLLTLLVCQKVITDVMTGHKAFRTDVLRDTNLDAKGFGVELELTVKLISRSMKILEIPIEYDYRKKGVSKISWRDGFKAVFWLFRTRLLG